MPSGAHDGVIDRMREIRHARAAAFRPRRGRRRGAVVVRLEARRWRRRETAPACCRARARRRTLRSRCWSARAFSPSASITRFRRRYTSPSSGVGARCCTMRVPSRDTRNERTEKLPSVSFCSAPVATAIFQRCCCLKFSSNEIDVVAQPVALAFGVAGRGRLRGNRWRTVGRPRRRTDAGGVMRQLPARSAVGRDQQDLGAVLRASEVEQRAAVGRPSAVASPPSPEVSCAGAPSPTACRQMCGTSRLAFQSARCSMYETVLPSGESCASTTGGFRRARRASSAAGQGPRRRIRRRVPPRRYRDSGCRDRAHRAFGPVPTHRKSNPQGSGTD